MKRNTIEDIVDNEHLEEVPKAMRKLDNDEKTKVIMKNKTEELPKAMRNIDNNKKIEENNKYKTEIPKAMRNIDSNEEIEENIKYKTEVPKAMHNLADYERTKRIMKNKLEEIPKAIQNQNMYQNTDNINKLNQEQASKKAVEKDSNSGENNNKRKKKKRKILKILLIIIFLLIFCLAVFIFLFFKTDLFQEYKELWVQTAMTTMNHQYLATWFLSEDEINAIMRENEVINNENSVLNAVNVSHFDDKDEENKKNNITVDKITGSGYVGYVMTISDPSKVKFVDARKKTTGTQLSKICKEHNAIAGINAGGFADPNGNGSGNILNEPTIIDKQLLFGEKNTLMNLTALTHSGELVLGKYTYYEAMNIGIQSGIQFGPYIIVNGNNQIKKANQGGLHPRMAIGQKKNGTIIFVCIDGRQPGYSIGTTLLEVQNIFERYGAYNAANLDGGSSATMYYNGKIINKTSTPMGERYLPNAIIVTQ